MKTKKKFITLKPKTPQAQEIFEYSMLGLQSCEILESTTTTYHLKPIKANFTMWIQSKDDENWEIEK